MSTKNTPVFGFRYVRSMPREQPGASSAKLRNDSHADKVKAKQLSVTFLRVKSRVLAENNRMHLEIRADTICSL